MVLVWVLHVVTDVAQPVWRLAPEIAARVLKAGCGREVFNWVGGQWGLVSFPLPTLPFPAW